MLPYKSERVSAVKLSSSRIWHTVRREPKEGITPQQPCPDMWHVGCHRVPVSRWQCRRMRGLQGVPRDSQRLFPAHPCPARIGAWDASQMKTQAASSSAAIISEGGQCHAEKGSCCPSCWASHLPQQLWKGLAPSRKHPAFSGFRLLKSTSSKERKYEPFTAWIVKGDLEVK